MITFITSPWSPVRRRAAVLLALLFACLLADARLGGQALADTQIGTTAGPAYLVGQLQATSLSPKSGAPVTYATRGIGNFSSSNYLSVSGQFIQFRPGNTLWLVAQFTKVNATGETLIGSSNPGTYTKGWWIQRAGADAASPTQGDLYFFRGDGGVWLGPQPVPQYTSTSVSASTTSSGIVAFAIVWKAADDSTWMSFDGGDLFQAGTVAPVAACDNSCTTYVGAGYLGAGTIPAASARLLDFAVTPTEASAANAAAYTLAARRALALPSAVTSAATVRLKGPDWNGSNSTVATEGSAPITLNVAGTPSLYAVAETEVTVTPSMLADGRNVESWTDLGGYKFSVTDPLTRVWVGKVDSAYVSATVYSSIITWGYNAQVGAYVAGSYAGALLLPFDSTNSDIPFIAKGPQVVTWQAGTEGTSRAIDLWNGPGDTNDYINQAKWRDGSTVVTVRYPKYHFDGVTLTSSTPFQTSKAPAYRVVFLTDYTTFWSTVYDSFAYSLQAQFRAAYPLPTDGSQPGHGFSIHGGDSYSMGQFYVETSDGGTEAPAFLAKLDGTTRTSVVVSLGRDDYEGPTGDSVADFTTFYQGSLNWMCSAHPGLHLYLVAPLNQAVENTNSYGSNEDAYRAAVMGLACPAGCTCYYKNCGGGACVSAGNIDSNSGLFPTQTGIVQLYGVIQSWLSGNGDI